MKKSVVSALTAALVVGAASTTFAAANPFSDVPANHWAYKSVTDLAAKGVIEGMGDGTYQGTRSITRYEMAQMVAKALAKNPTGADKAELEKLKAYFQDELNSLGVRVDELEKHSDMVKWNGKIEYTYNHRKYTGRRDMRGANFNESGHDGVFRLEPRAEVNDHWTAVARLDATYNGKQDVTGNTQYYRTGEHHNNVKLKRIYAEGDYSKFNVKIGRFGVCPDYEDGLVLDSVASGIDLNFGSKWKVNLTAGRIGADSDEAHFGPFGPNKHTADWTSYNIFGDIANVVDGPGDDTDFIRLGVQYADNGEKGVFGGASYTHAKDKDFAVMSKNDNDDKAQVYAFNLGYRFNDKLKVWGSVGRNSKASSHLQKTAWQLEVKYGNYGDYANKGDWAVWAGYSKFSRATAIGTAQSDDISTGEKGWHIGAAYAPFKNVGLLLRYADGKDIETNMKDKHFWGRVEFFF